MYVRAFRTFTNHAFGVEIDLERAVEAGHHLPNIALAPGECLPFPDGSFDAVLLNEVIEHMADDRQAIAEAVRVLRPGGRVVVFAPNRLYPFETHGVYWRGQYHFGNIPLVGYLPDGVRHRFAPHVRAYTVVGLRRLFNDLPVTVVVHTQVYPGYDNLVGRHPAFGRALRRVTYLAEGTPLRAFGLSHFLVAEKHGDG
jgi:SAM-dependent methyltransferase